MRVIAGKAKRIKLKTIEGLETRPTTDRIKETLFNMIQPMLIDSNFLDLFSGSGAIGIEALSRGAKSAVFVENNKNSVNCIRENLVATNLMQHTEVMHMDVCSAMTSLDSKGKSFDIIFMDPPYNNQLEHEVLNFLEHSSLVHMDSIIIIEASLDTEFELSKDSRFRIYKQKEYKTNKHLFLELV